MFVVQMILLCSFQNRLFLEESHLKLKPNDASEKGTDEQFLGFFNHLLRQHSVTMIWKRAELNF